MTDKCAKSENEPSYINLLEEQFDIKWKRVAADYLVAERETLEPEKRERKCVMRKVEVQHK